MYRTRSIPVKAMKFERFEPMPDWIAKALEDGKISMLESSYGRSMMDCIVLYSVETDLMNKTASVGDWIVQYPDGGLDVFDDKEFHEKFEVVEGETEDGFQ